MMIYKYVLDKEWGKGEVQITFPKYKERIQMLKDMNFNLNAKEVNISSEQVDLLGKMYDLVMKRIVSFNITLAGEDKPINSLEDIECYDFFNQLIGDLGGVLFNGMKLGNPTVRP